jgi:hypothetical protein
MASKQGRRAVKRNRDQNEGLGLKRRFYKYTTANYPFSLSPRIIPLTRLALCDATAKEAPCLVDGLFCLVVGPAVFAEAPTLVGSCSTEKFEEFH